VCVCVCVCVCVFYSRLGMKQVGATLTCQRVAFFECNSNFLCECECECEYGCVCGYMYGCVCACMHVSVLF